MCNMEMQTALNPLSSLQCKLIIQEYLPRDGTLENIAYDQALSLLSEALFDRQQRIVLERTLLFSQNFETFGYVIDKSQIMKGGLDDHMEIEFLLNAKNPSTKNPTAINYTGMDVVFSNLIVSAIKNKWVKTFPSPLMEILLALQILNLEKLEFPSIGYKEHRI